MKVETPSLNLEIKPLPWDEKVLGSSVIQFEKLVVRHTEQATQRLQSIMQEMADKKVGFISCRLPHNAIQESMILEGLGFKFIEVVLHPFINLASHRTDRSCNSIKIEEAKPDELKKLSEIVEIAFDDDRFSVDLRIPRNCSGTRYKNWVLSSEKNSKQKVLNLSENSKSVGIFIVEENHQHKKAYWHLTAIAPQYQGKGLGAKCWLSMLAKHKKQGFKEVSTTISSRNSRVLNLYSKMNFRFSEPEMTFHWINPNLF